VDAGYTACASAVAAFSAAVNWTNHLIIVICDNGKCIQKRQFIASNFSALEDMAPISQKLKNLKSPNFRFFRKKTLKIQMLDSQSQKKIVAFQSN